MTMRALVTRPRLQAETFAAELARRGVEPVVEPLIEIADCLAALPEFAGVQAILCTSVNGVRALARATGDRQAPVFAVGDATARAARAAGFERVESAGGDVGDLARLVCGRLRPGGGRLLHVAGSAVAGDLAGRLGASGFAVERAVLYQAHAVAALTPATARRPRRRLSRSSISSRVSRHERHAGGTDTARAAPSARRERAVSRNRAGGSAAAAQTPCVARNAGIGRAAAVAPDRRPAALAVGGGVGCPCRGRDGAILGPRGDAAASLGQAGARREAVLGIVYNPRAAGPDAGGARVVDDAEDGFAAGAGLPQGSSGITAGAQNGTVATPTRTTNATANSHGSGAPDRRPAAVAVGGGVGCPCRGRDGAILGPRGDAAASLGQAGARREAVLGIVYNPRAAGPDAGAGFAPGRTPRSEDRRRADAGGAECGGASAVRPASRRARSQARSRAARPLRDPAAAHRAGKGERRTGRQCHGG